LTPRRLARALVDGSRSPPRRWPDDAAVRNASASWTASGVFDSRSSVTGRVVSPRLPNADSVIALSLKWTSGILAYWTFHEATASVRLEDMSAPPLSSTPRSTPNRTKHRTVTDRAALYEVLDAGLICHLGIRSEERRVGKDCRSSW